MTLLVDNAPDNPASAFAASKSTSVLRSRPFNTRGPADTAKKIRKLQDCLNKENSKKKQPDNFPDAAKRPENGPAPVFTAPGEPLDDGCSGSGKGMICRRRHKTYFFLQ